MITREDRIRGGMVGLLIGDALGVPYEFKKPHHIPPREEIDLLQYPHGWDRAIGEKKSWSDVPMGTWSDDGALALALADSLTTRKKLHPNDLAMRFGMWFHEGRYAVDRIVFDVGNTTREAIHNFRMGVPAELAGGDGPRSAGNGSLMRALPLALWHKGTEEELIRDAKIQSSVTHRHPLALECCALYCLIARRMLNETSLYANPFPMSSELAHAFTKHGKATGTGYVIDSYVSAVTACGEGTDYRDVVTRAIAYGNDTDTTAAIAGGLAGVKFGINGIPREWREGLRSYDEIAKPIVERLVGS